ncbi:MAG: (2Fe-2S) ferredoxin domain-containing protein [Eubacterium sp.]|nr:(2Fe-2S) ferredoxin domain-containing protein [Eubacterium sp.]
MKITVCIGTSCHVKGSRQIVEQLQYLIREKGLGDRIELSGKLCMSQCRKGICVTVDDDLFTVDPCDVDSFFENTVLTRLQ